MCPYCGSIELKGNKCKWCHSKIPDKIVRPLGLNNKKYDKNKGGTEND